MHIIISFVGIVHCIFPSQNRSFPKKINLNMMSWLILFFQGRENNFLPICAEKRQKFEVVSLPCRFQNFCLKYENSLTALFSLFISQKHPMCIYMLYMHISFAVFSKICLKYETTLDFLEVEYREEDGVNDNVCIFPG